MKYAIVLIAALALALPCHGQDQGQDLPDYNSKKNELNIGYFNLFNLMGTNTLGVGYKRSGNIGAFRVGTGFGLSYLSNKGEDYEYNINGFSVYPRIGYEFHTWLKRFRVHYGAEFVAGYSKNGRETDSSNGEYIESNSTTTKSLAIRPLMGVSFFIHPSISIATEAYLNIAWTTVENENVSNANTSYHNNSEMITSLGPLGIVSINFHF